MTRRPVLALLALALLGPRLAAAHPTDLGEIVPADAVLYVTSDGIGALQSSLTDALSAVAPGAGASMVALALAGIPGLDRVDRARPVAIAILPSGGRLIALPVRDPRAFAEELRSSPASRGTSVTAGAGHSLVTIGRVPPLDVLRRQPMAKPPELAGDVRGFVNLAALSAMRNDTSDPAAAAMLRDAAAAVPRVDFALRASRAGMELEAAFAPAGDGVMAVLARTRVPSSPNRFLAAVPAGSVIVGTAYVTDELAAAAEAALERLARPLTVPVRQRVALRRMERRARRLSSLTRGESAFAVAAPGDASSLSIIQAYACRDVRRTRILLRKLWRGGVLAPGLEAKTELRVAAGRIGDVPVDEQVVRLAATEHATEPAAEHLARLYGEPIRYAYPTGAVISTVGPGGRERLEASLASFAAGTVDPDVALALTPGTVLAVAWDVGALARMARSLEPAGLAPLSAGPGERSTYATLRITPQAGSVDVVLGLPSASVREMPTALARALAQAAVGPR